MSKIADRLREIRDRQGLSQEKLADILGITRPAVSELERGARRLSAEELSRLAKALSISADYILGLVDLPEVTLEYDALAEEELVSYGEAREDAELIMRQPKQPARISVPRENVQKFKEALLHITTEVGSRPNVGETVIYKMLYFIDFDYYEKYEEQLIGASYQKSPFGPTPVEFDTIVEQMIADDELHRVARTYHGHEQKKYLPIREADLSIFSGSEIAMINDVIARLSRMGARQISEYSHNDIPWLTAQIGEIIPYESVFDRTAQYSVRDYKEE